MLKATDTRQPHHLCVRRRSNFNDAPLSSEIGRAQEWKPREPRGSEPAGRRSLESRARRMKKQADRLRHIAEVLGVSHGTILTVLKAALDSWRECVSL